MMQCQINSAENTDHKEICVYVCYLRTVSWYHKSMDLSVKYKSMELIEENISKYLCELRA